MKINSPTAFISPVRVPVLGDHTSFAWLWSVDGPDSTAEKEMLERAMLAESDKIRYNSLQNARRRTEWLASRVLAREKLHGRIESTASGRPQLIHTDGTLRHISVSHTDGYVSILQSDRPCGVDIERTCRDLSPLARRFVTEHEWERSQHCFPDNPFLLIWCAKEVAFKAVSEKEVDFLRELEVEKVTPHELIVRHRDHRVGCEYFTVGNLLVVCGALR